MTGEQKRLAYRDLGARIAGLLAAPSDPVATMANVAAAVHHALPYASWTGFYRVVRPGLLRVGPFQGPVACVDIPFERGVCGAAARTGETQVVADVHAFEGHVACDPAARSEIVIPLRDAAGDVFAVLDVDSHLPAAFDDVDREELEKLAARFVHGLIAV
ncbi:MAG: GAF domain-containing protein [Acidobacteriota bacterium]|nr:GAF domain-containing protein [Acidobacteriota bacterium]